MYEASDIKVGQVLLCVDNGGFPFWTTGKQYEVVADEQGKPCMYSDSGEQPLSHRTANDISVYLNSQPKNGDVVMQLIEDGKEEPTMTEQNKDFTGLKAGDKLTRSGERTSWWTEGAKYPVYGDDNTFYIKDDEGDRSWFTVEKDGTVSNYDVQRGFYWNKPEKKIYTLDDLKEGMVLRCTDDKGYDFWTTGKEYTVYRDDKGVYIENEISDRSYNHQVLIRLNGKGSNATMEVVSTPEPQEPEEITLTITGATYYELEEQLQKALDVVQQINYHGSVLDTTIKQLNQFKGDK